MREMDKGWSHFSLHFTAPSLDDCPKSQFQDPTRLPTMVITPQGPFSQAMLNIFTSRLTYARSFNFTRGLFLHKDYVTSVEFMARKGMRAVLQKEGTVSRFFWYIHLAHRGQHWLFSGCWRK